MFDTDSDVGVDNSPVAPNFKLFEVTYIGSCFVIAEDAFEAEDIAHNDADDDFELDVRELDLGLPRIREWLRDNTYRPYGQCSEELTLQGLVQWVENKEKIRLQKEAFDAAQMRLGFEEE